MLCPGVETKKGCRRSLASCERRRPKKLLGQLQKPVKQIVIQHAHPLCQIGVRGEERSNNFVWRGGLLLDVAL